MAENNTTKLFLKEIRQRLTTDIRKDERGCLIPDVKVRLGSKICIDRFYEADLLFQNLGDIKRFAQVIIFDILDKIEKKYQQYNNIFILGYEEYSSTLVQQISSGIKKAKAKEQIPVEWVVLKHNAGKHPSVNFDRFPAGYIKSQLENKGTLCVNVLPIGTTLSTIYKMQNAFTRGICNELGYKEAEDKLGFLNYCIVAVGNVYCSDILLKEEERIAKKFLVLPIANDENGNIWHDVELRSANGDVSKRAKVQYLIPVEAKWAEIKIDSTRKEPMLHVDETSTALNYVFQSKLPNEHYTYYKKDSRIELLKPQNSNSYIRYGHIARGDNHYQFYFNFEKLTEQLFKSQPQFDELSNWAGEERNKIDGDAYNIVISPLQVTNSAFLTYVADNIFGSNLHLLHIDIDSSKKEVVRTRYSYVKNDIKQIIESGRKINFYYVDDSVCSGNTLARAYKLLQMLYNQASVDTKKGAKEKFKLNKVFLLINRSSYETASQWVDDPNNDWCGFINLCVPSYNTHAGTCPGCKVRDRFDVLAKRSVTNDLTSYFYGESIKHELRSIDEFDIWQEDSILNKPSYFQWFTSYIYYHGNEQKEFDKKTYDELSQHIKNFYADPRKNGEKWHDMTLSKLFQWSDEHNCGIKKQNCIDLMKTIIAEDNYLRLKTMDTAYRDLVYNNSAEPIEERVQNLLLKAAEDKNAYHRFMGLISYVKVISRDYLVNNYYIRQSIINAMRNILDIMLCNEEEQEELKKQEKTKNLFNKIRNTKEEKPPKKISSALQFRLFNLIAHRLALLDDHKLIDENLAATIIGAHSKLSEIDEAEKIFCPIIDIDKALIQFVGSIKTSVMHRNNDVLCQKVNDFAKKIFNDDDKDCQKFGNLLLLENTRMLFDFVEELSLDLTEFGKKIDADWRYEGYDGCGGLKHRYNIWDNNSEIGTKIKSVLGYKSHQYHLYKFVASYKMQFTSNENSTTADDVKTIRNMIKYFNITQFLSESEYEKKKNEKFHNLPYIYEDLCITLAELTDSDNCYLIYRKDGEDSQVVSRTYCIKEGNNFFNEDDPEDLEHKYGVNIGHKEFNNIVNNFNNVVKTDKNTIHLLTSGIGKTFIGDVKKEYLIIKLPLNLMQDSNNDGRFFYIILEHGRQNECQISESDKQKLYKVLFLRNRIWEALREDYARLMNFRYHCSFLEPITTVKDDRTIWHISDLHMGKRIFSDGELTTFSELLKELREEKTTPELLAVTGDIVNGSSDAATAQKRYMQAGNILFKIVKRLWGIPRCGKNDMIYLPYDWRRRVLITTGNHDYATMGSVSVQTKERQISSATPARSTGGTMAKFTYLIEFLTKFLDAPPKMLIDDDINEIRHYKYLNKEAEENKLEADSGGLFIGIFNTSSHVNALQNNKVGINKPVLTRITENGKWNDDFYKNEPHIVLVHHSPFYVANEMDYVEDKYAPHQYWKDRNNNDIPEKKYIKFFFKDFTKALIYTAEILLNERRGHSKVIQKFLDGFESFKKRASKDEDFFKSNLMADMQMLYDTLQDKMLEKPIREYGYDLLAKSHILHVTQEEDKKAYKDVCKLLQCDSQECIFIAGHIHRSDKEHKTVNELFAYDKLNKLNKLNIAEYKFNTSTSYKFLE